jgi:hypothetical protein
MLCCRQAPPEAEVDFKQGTERRASAGASPSTGSISQAVGGSTEAEIAQFLAARRKDPSIEWKTVMNFWGRVLDEHDVPIAGASVNFSWTDLSATGHQRSFTNSNAAGDFSHTGRTGKRLLVTVSKAGYYSFPDQFFGAFEYGDPWERFHPDPKNPVAFRLKKAGVWEPLDFRGGLIKLREDRSRLILNFENVSNRKEGPLEIFIWRDPKREKGRPFDWSLSVRVPSGGVAPWEGDFPGSAPEEGYQPEMKTERKADDPKWNRSLSVKYYFKFGSPEHFGRIEIQQHMANNEWISLNYWINPRGSRNLEADPARSPAALPE